jgi:hypothetical protein
MLWKRGYRASWVAMPALNTGKFKAEPRPMVTTMYRSSMSLAVGVTGSLSAVESSVVHSAAGALGFVRIESARVRRAAAEGQPLLASIFTTNQYG